MTSTVWAIADLHLAFGVPEKHMKVFGENWEHYTEKIEDAWRLVIQEHDLVLIPGDISWALHVEDARPDLEWIGQLPGTKVLLKGNHDLWWGSLSKVQRLLPPSCHVIQNNSFLWRGVSVGGSRLWDSAEFQFNDYIDYKENPRAKGLSQKEDDEQESARIFDRELGRLETSLRSMSPQAAIRIAMTHYPPLSADLKDSRASQLLEKYGVQYCVFGHLHNVKKNCRLFGVHHGIQYALTACDYLDFKPLKVCTVKN